MHVAVRVLCQKATTPRSMEPFHLDNTFDFNRGSCCRFFLPRSKRRKRLLQPSSLRFQVKCLLFSMKRSEKSFNEEDVPLSRFGAVLFCARSAYIAKHKGTGGGSLAGPRDRLLAIIGRSVAPTRPSPFMEAVSERAAGTDSLSRLV
ncbi:uncharacterized protein LOC144104406 [Amblyomma americanum]